MKVSVVITRFQGTIEDVTAFENEQQAERAYMDKVDEIFSNETDYPINGTFEEKADYYADNITAGDYANEVNIYETDVI